MVTLYLLKNVQSRYSAKLDADLQFLELLVFFFKNTTRFIYFKMSRASLKDVQPLILCSVLM